MQRAWKRRWQRTVAKLLLPPVMAAGIFFSAYSIGLASPSGATVTAGTAAIATSGNKMTITTSDKVAINWQSYNIAKSETVQYIQPSSSSVALNRMIGSDASKIYGTLSANGKVFLLNPNGVLFAPGSSVNVGGLVASTLHLSDSDFLNNHYKFSGDSSAAVINQGSITATDGGYVALLGAQAKNEGVIVANQGTVALGAGKAVTLDLAGDGFLNLVVDQSALSASVTNSGVIQADGGKVYMSARTADALAGTVINNSGTIQARSISSKNGVIILDGGSSSTVVNSGTLDASGTAGGQIGGTVKVLGDTVALAAGTSINVSGDAGGGIALIGGNYQGKGTERNATTTTVVAGATINANAITVGNGGKVVVWANDTTNFAGSISARGGSFSGNGGNVEVSGKNTLTYQGHTVTTAANGRTGNLLLDPTDFTIGTGATVTGKYWNNTGLVTELGSNNVTVQTLADGTDKGDITVSAPISWGSGNTLTLQAHRNINVNAAITSTGAGNLIFKPNGTGNPDAPGYLLVGSGGSVHFSGTGKLYFGSQEYTLINDLAGWNSMGMSGFYALNADIIGVTGWIGTTASPFKATLEGLGHKVTVNINSGSYTKVGLFGRTEIGALIRNVGVAGSITGMGECVGGLIGSNYGGNVINCYSTVGINMTNATDVGGLVGMNAANGMYTGQIINSYSTGTMTGNSWNAGGLVGKTSIGGSIVNSYSTVAVNTNGYYSGGLVGENGGTINNSYSTGDVTGSTYAGGLVGHNKNAIRTSFSTGKVSASTAGGLVGERAGFEDIVNCFWDKENSNLTDAVGETANELSLPGATGMTTAQMKTASTFTGWDQAVWKFYDGSSVPLLKNLLKPLTITASAADITKTYDGLTTAYSGSFTYSTGTKPAEVVGTLGYAGGGVNAGVYLPTGLYSGQQGGYDITVINNGGTLTVTPASLTYTANAASRIYGDANPALSGSVSGFKGSDTQGSVTTGTLAWSTGATATSNVGSYAITGGGLTLTTNNYVFAQEAGNATKLSVTPATLTYTAATTTRLYGDANPTLAGTVVGWKNGESQSGATSGTLTWTSTATTASNVGDYTINGGGLTANNGNYVFTQATGNATALSVTPATLTYTANAATRLYGDANAANFNGGSITGWKNGQDQASATSGTLTWTSAATPTSNVGTYTIDGSGLTANNGNYVFAQATGNATALSVTPATLTYTANAATRLYGDANAADFNGGSITGWKNGENQAAATTGTLTWTSTATPTSNVGTYTINGSGLTANHGNYVFAQAAGNTSALTVNKATLTYTANAVSRTYGDANSTLSGTVVGWRNADNQGNATSGTLSWGTTADVTSNVGSYAINGSGLTATNYVFTQAAGNASALTVNKATLTYTANAVSRTYGDANSTLSGTVVGWKNADNQGNATSGRLSWGTAADGTSNIGSYAINGSGLTATNYNFVQATPNATALTVNKATLTVSANAVSKIYGASDPVLTYGVSGLKNGEQAGDILSGNLSRTAGETVAGGPYSIGQGTLVVGNNYAINYTGGSLTITPQPLTVTANNATKTMGTVNPAFSATYSGLVAGDTPATSTGPLVFGTTATTSSPVGSYAIIPTGTSVSSNYTVTYVNGVLTVTRIPDPL